MNCFALISRETVLPVRFIEGPGFGFTVYDPSGEIHHWVMLPSDFMELYRRAYEALAKTLDGVTLDFGPVSLDIDDEEDVWLRLDHPGLHYKVKVTCKFLEGLVKDMDKKAVPPKEDDE